MVKKAKTSNICVSWRTLQKQSLEVFSKKSVLKNFANVTGKHLSWSLFLIKLQACRLVALLKRDSNTGAFLWKLRSFEENLFWGTSTNDCFCSKKGAYLQQFWNEESIVLKSLPTPPPPPPLPRRPLAIKQSIKKYFMTPWGPRILWEPTTI